MTTGSITKNQNLVFWGDSVGIFRLCDFCTNVRIQEYPIPIVRVKN